MYNYAPFLVSFHNCNNTGNTGKFSLLIMHFLIKMFPACWHHWQWDLSVFPHCRHLDVYVNIKLHTNRQAHTCIVYFVAIYHSNDHRGQKTVIMVFVNHSPDSIISSKYFILNLKRPGTGLYSKMIHIDVILLDNKIMVWVTVIMAQLHLLYWYSSRPLFHLWKWWMCGRLDLAVFDMIPNHQELRLYLYVSTLRRYSA